ncbi:MAG: hypothetical protein NTY38_31155, partial [Acidobacteria bacterium]|nr:hypothetical protein [Acidobacteriota bacterium]
MHLRRVISRTPLLTRFLIGNAFLAAASVLCLSTMFLLRHRSAFERQFELRAESLARSLAAECESSLLLDNPSDLDRIAGAAINHEDVLYVAFDDRNGKTVAGRQRSDIKRSELPRPVASAAPVDRRLVHLGTTHTAVEVSLPVVPHPEGALFDLAAARPIVLGRVRVGLSLESQGALFRETLGYVVMIASLSVLIFSILCFFGTRDLLGPLDD